MPQGAVGISDLAKELLTLPETGRQQQRQAPRLHQSGMQCQHRDGGGFARLPTTVEECPRGLRREHLHLPGIGGPHGAGHQRTGVWHLHLWPGQHRLLQGAQSGLKGATAHHAAFPFTSTSMSANLASSSPTSRSFAYWPPHWAMAWMHLSFSSASPSGVPSKMVWASSKAPQRMARSSARVPGLWARRLATLA